MPELAEVEFFRKRWHLAATGQRITGVRLHPHAKIFRGTPVAAIRRNLAGAVLLGSAAAAKQILFRFQRTSALTFTRSCIRSKRADENLTNVRQSSVSSAGGAAADAANAAAHAEVWLGIHLGMSGELLVQPAAYRATRHDHMILDTQRHALVFNDPRMFGRVLLHLGAEPPGWWTRIAPAVLSPAFTADTVEDFLQRRARAPIKAVLLMQEQFPGIGNWMADEILWRAGIHPRRTAGSLTSEEISRLWSECRRVCRLALDTIAGRGDTLPPDLNVNIPESWLFRHRWREGGRCPRTRVPLVREEIGGRTTCWSPARQPLKPVAARQPAPSRRRGGSARPVRTR